MVDPRMDALTWLRKQLENDCPDLARAMLQRIAGELMGAEADALCGAPYSERNPERVNSRNGYRIRRWDTRAGTIDLEIPKLRSGSYFPDWLIAPRRRAEKALVAAIADAYLAGVSTRRVDKLVASSASRASRRAKSRRSPGALTRRSRPSRAARWPAPTPTSGSTPCWCAAATTRCGWRASAAWWPSGSTRRAGARCWGWSWRAPRTGPAGSASCAACSPAACRASSW